MATTPIALTFNVDSLDVPDIVAALKQNYANNGKPNPTQAEAIEALRQEVMAKVMNLTKQYRANLATAGVVTPVAT